MTTIETLGCRRDMTEGEMFEVAASLSRRLRRLGERIDTMASDVHTLVFQSGRMPIEQKTHRILLMIHELSTDPELEAASDEADVVTELKARVSDYEDEFGRQLKERTDAASRAERLAAEEDEFGRQVGKPAAQQVTAAA